VALPLEAQGQPSGTRDKLLSRPLTFATWERRSLDVCSRPCSFDGNWGYRV